MNPQEHLEPKCARLQTLTDVNRKTNTQYVTETSPYISLPDYSDVTCLGPPTPQLSHRNQSAVYLFKQSPVEILWYNPER